MIRFAPVGDFPFGFGRYQLVERLAVGGMAELFLATSPGEHGFQKRVVIKRLLPHLIEDATYNAMFIDEAKLTARLVHPKIAQTFELGRVEDSLYIAMEHIDGIDVLALLREFASRRRRLAQPLAAWIAHEVLDALDYAHNITGEDGRALGIVHRDISPSNVLLSARGDIKLVDFGIARAVDPDRAHKSKSGTLKGKYGYMSPEQVIEQGLDSRSDLFSVGVVLAELLTGRRLFAAANELDVLLMVRDAKLARFDKYGADIEPGLAGIVRKALRKSVDERWQTAAAFRDALGEWLYDQRHRVTSRIVADVVLELRDAVVERRLRQVGTLPVEPARIARPEPAETDGMVIDIEIGDSMPNISVSYELPPAVVEERRGRAASVSDVASALPALPPLPSVRSVPSIPSIPSIPSPVIPSIPSPSIPSVATTRAPTVPGRPALIDDPARGRQTDADRQAIPQPVTRQPPTEPLHVSWLAAQEARSRPPSASDPFRIAADAVVEVPIADTISAAVEAITLPSRNTEDSVIRAFDDLDGAEAARPQVVRRPTTEEVLQALPPAPPELAEISEPPDDAGELSATPPLRVLFRLMTARATGLLVVAVGGVKKDIYVRDGMPEYVSSNVPSELFGNYLVTKGVLSEGELAMALAMMPHYGGKLGDTLVGLGLMKPLEVFRHLTRQVRTKIIDVCSWTRGTFAWYAGRENPREAFPLDFNAFEILGAGAMGMADDHVESWTARYGKVRLRAARTRRVGPERFEVQGLVELFEQLDGRRSVGELVELAADQAERLRTGRMLCLLESCDLARPA
jgi:serine/threonine protein kinase